MKPLLTLALLLWTSQVLADPLAADAARRAAMIVADIAALEQMFTDDLTYTHSNGLVQSKDELLAALQSGVLQYVSIEVDGERVQQRRGVGIVTGQQRLEVRSRGEPITAASRYTATYVSESGGWRLAAYQSTNLPELESAQQIPGDLSAAFNDRDIDAMLDLVTENVKWLTIDGDEVLTELSDAPSLRQFLEGYFLAFPDVRSRVADTLDAGRFVAFREHVRWTSEGREKAQMSLGVAQIDGGKIRRVWYFPAQIP